MAFSTPILFIAFNRPQQTALTFQQICRKRPKQLFIAADGPRNDSEKQACERVREIIQENIDWDCQTQYLFRDKNLGCKEAVSSSISWFFEHVEEGIILEDDCLANDSFFDFCAEMLQRYRNVSDIFSISGNHFLPNNRFIKHDYYFLKTAHIWGWATWKRVWSLYSKDISISHWHKKSADLRHWLKRDEFRYWTSIFSQVAEGKIDTWDYQLNYLSFMNRGVHVMPAVNLVKNIGFVEGEGTHHGTSDSPFANMDTKVLRPPYVGPLKTEVHQRANRFIQKQNFLGKAEFSPTNFLKNAFLKWIKDGKQ